MPASGLKHAMLNKNGKENLKKISALSIKITLKRGFVSPFYIKLLLNLKIHLTGTFLFVPLHRNEGGSSL